MITEIEIYLFTLNLNPRQKLHRVLEDHSLRGNTFAIYKWVFNHGHVDQK